MDKPTQTGPLVVALGVLVVVVATALDLDSSTAVWLTVPGAIITLIGVALVLLARRGP